MATRYWFSFLFAAVAVIVVPAGAHDWHRHDDPQFANAPFVSPHVTGPRASAVKLLAANSASSGNISSAAPPASFAPATLGAANLFAQTYLKFHPSVRFWWDSANFYIEGDGTPAHNMMEGISSWQRQIPVPPYYFGTNIWALPLYPVAAATNDLVATNKFTQGAIALAANGIPIFNPYNNTGKISAQIGELDLWGGHCGRGDDYHYHAAPLHLTNTLGISLPLAFAMDGYPVYGLVEPDGSALATNTLDNVAGHTNGTGSYHYHASTSFPYINGGFHGVITVVTNGSATQAGVQPRAGGVRPAGTPLSGAYIQIFTNIGPDQFQMFYSRPSNSSPAFATNYWLYTLNRASNSVTVTYSSYDGVSGPTTTNYNNWRPAPAFTSTNEPLVTTQPTNLTLAAGSTATFSITAAGFGTLAYQWFQDGAELANGNGIGGVNSPTLTITNVQAGDAGGYSVVVTNTVGNTLSAAATLTVTGGANTPPTLNPIANRFLFPGQTLLITNVAGDAETPGSLTFSLNSSLPGPTINTSNGLVTWATTTNNANSTNTLTVVVADNGSPNLTATQLCTVTVVGARSISQGLATTVVSNLFPAGQRVSGVGTITAFDGTVWTVPSATPYTSSPKLPDLWSQTAGVTPTNIAAAAPAIASLTTNVIDTDGEVITGYIFGDNYFELYVNGVLVGVDPVPFTPFNSCVVKFKARRPITYAVRLVDWEENLGVGTELNGGNPNHSGDGGFIASFSDGTVTGPNWKAQSFYIAPLDNPNLVLELPDGSHDSSSASNSTTLGTNAYALHYGVPENWSAKSFNHSNWPAATTFTEAQVGVNNQWAYLNFPGQFSGSGAQFIWSKNLVLDNEVIVRFTGPASNMPPVFSALATNRFVLTSGQSLVVTNTATDADVPAQTLTYSLLSPPAGATINPGNGVVTWNTTTNNSGTSNLFRVVVTDNGSPSLSATNSFNVFVRSLKPNVFVIVTDDQGFGDISAHGGPAATPNMDRLGSEGIRLERFYPTPVCSVTRSTLMTGRNPIRTSVNNTRGLDLREHMMPVTFKAAGYQTYMCGKWHLGGLYNTDTNTVINGVNYPVIRENVDYQPQNRGWDVHYGEYTGAIGYSNHISQEFGTYDWWLNGQTNLDQGWSTDLLANKAIQLFQQRDPSKPAIVYLAFNAVHGPVSAPASYLNKYPSATGNRKNTLAALDQMDEAIGRVLNAIDAENVTTNTLVVYFSDNGGQAASGGSNLPLRGDKGDLFDGGIHTPAAVRWPGVLPGGVTNCQQFMWSGDWFPTICAATGVTPLNTKPFDGTNMWPLLLAATNGPFNPASYRGGPFASGSSAGSGIFNVFTNTNGAPTMFKLIRDKLPGAGAGFTNYLFDIVNDPYESNDVVNVPAYTGIFTSLSNYYNTLTTERYPPYLGVHPQSQSAPAGTNVTLWAMTTAYAKPVTTQWRKNGTNIAGATNNVIVDTDVYLPILNLANVSAGDTGSYDVVVTDNATGWGTTTATSLVAVLTITAPGSNTPPVLTAVSNRTIYLGATLLVTNVATDAEAPPQVLSFTLPVAPSGAGINASSGLITWTPTGGQLGTNAFSVVATDNGSPNLSATQTFAVIVLPTAPLTISGTGRNPSVPTSAQPVNITATVTSGTNISAVTLFHAASGVTNSVAMLDNGLNNDGAAGDGVFGGQIPARSAGTLVSYYVGAQDASGAMTNDPPTAPASMYSYTVLNSGTGWSMLKLPDTGQTGDFTTLFGEDSDYLTNAPSYTDNGNGTITDNITGLMWQKDFSPEMTWENAVTYADTNALGGHTDWRLPNTHELVSINHFGVNPPAYNTTFFTMTGTGNTNFWWTSDPRANDATRIWTGSRAAVFAPRLKTDTLSAGGSNSIHVRMVRGAPAPTNSPIHSFVNNGDGTITDSDTGLMWQQGEIGAALDWSNALTYAESLVLAGYSDWRLPNAKELQSINDEKLFNPSLDTNFFLGAKIARYWTSTTRQQNPATNSWYMDFQFGNLNAASKLDLYWVRAVRGPISGGSPANTAPQLTAQPDRTVEPGYTLLVTNVATDAQSPPQTLTFSLLAPPANASINPSSGVLTFAPVVGQLGTSNTITVVVTDSGTPALSATNSYKAIVVANTAPVLTAISNRVLNPGDTLLVTNNTSDAEAPPQTFAYRLTNSPAGATINPTTGLITWVTSGANADTTNNFTVVVADNGIPSLSTTQSFSVVVNPGSSVITYDLLLGRPTATSIAVSVLASNNLQVYFEYGTNSGVYTSQNATNSVTNGVPRHLTIDSLLPNTRYYYRMRFSATGGAPFASSPERTFATQRARGSTFSFLIEADPHNRDNVPDVWKLAMTNMLADNADFLLDLGDTFFEEKVAATNAYYLTRPGIFELHQEVRNGFFRLAGHSLPLFLVSGNHDPELGWLANSTNNPAVWGVQARQYLYPVPQPSPTGFYSGSTNIDPYTLAPRDAYYAFEWGDALFVTLDPYWYSTPKPNADGWSWTLGTNQYYWLKQTLEKSTAKFKFVFAHHLIGGGGGGEARGGLTYHNNFEWGGWTTNGGYDFPTRRPGWPAPIKDLLLSNNVQAFFHGHDHLYVKEDFYKPGNTNGVPDFIYQEVPQPSQTIYGTNAAPGYGYTNGPVLPSSGHLRVTVSPTNAKVEYIRVFLPANEGTGRTNKMISASYNIPAPVVGNGWSMLKLPDTGQTTSYTTVPGEDSDYSINPPSYTDNGNGTTTDNVTGLMWQKADGGEMTLSNALLFAQTNLNPANFAGYNDWRLPTIHELASILNQDRSNPALDTNYFTSPGVAPGTWNQVYWWSKDQLRNGTNQWCANAGGGVGPKPLHETISAGGTLNYRVRAVRGVPAPITPRSHYINNGNGTITDTDTALTWQQAEIGAATDWTNALIYAEGLVLAGFQDWRLPNLKELESLNDETLGSPSTDTNFFPGAKSARYWSSTTQNNAQTNAWFNESVAGITSQASKANNYWVRAVRGGLSNTAPLLATNANYTINAGVTLQLTNTASDAQTAPGFLIFSLLASPSNASLGASSGVFTWRPAVAQAGTTNTITVVVADTGLPILNATQSFTVAVNPLSNSPGAIPLGMLGSQLQLQVTGDVGPDYTVQASTNLSAWTNLFTTNSPITPFLWLDPSANNYTSRFYRVLLGP